MATLLLTAVGSAIGGPLGSAIGALIGRSVDSAVIGGRNTEGPRLKELSVQTSSYGAALPLHYGSMRAAGSVIWSTELIEHREKQGTGKGRPSVTAYTYAVSFAVALASRPIIGIGRIWADGNLLRGAEGDLKIGGSMRIHTGHGDQQVDPLLGSAEGISRCPAYRQTAYVVFEDLQLADFGNRLPSLTFEVFADPADCMLATIVRDILPEAQLVGLDRTMAGFSIDRGSVGDILTTISEAIPISCSTRGEVLDIRLAEPEAFADIPMLSPPAASEDPNADTAKAEGWTRRREPMPRIRQCGVRYYDIGRDYQPGLQRGVGRSAPGDIAVIELAAALSATEARVLADLAGRRTAQPRDIIRYRTTEIDTTVVPGSIVRIPVAPGLWRVEQWEWQADGVMLDLVAAQVRSARAIVGASGRINAPADLSLMPTTLAAFELPWDGMGSGDSPALFAAASGSSAGWSGAALFSDSGTGELLSLGSSGRRRAVMGACETSLEAASPVLFDTRSTLTVALVGSDLTIPTATLSQLLQGANRALVGSEIIQFCSAEPLGAGRWRLSGLLRGRGGTEWAIGLHDIDDTFVLIDDALIALDATLLGDAWTTTIVASGLGDDIPVATRITNAGSTRQPIAPVHGIATRSADGGLILGWTRRSRGSWTWSDNVDVPLNEESETWDITYGDDAAPIFRWQLQTTTLSLTASQVATLTAVSAPATFHIRQRGRASASMPLTLYVPAA